MNFRKEKQNAFKVYFRVYQSYTILTDFPEYTHTSHLVIV